MATVTSCENGQLVISFIKKVDGKTLCLLCTLSYKRILHKAKKGEKRVSGQDQHKRDRCVIKTQSKLSLDPGVLHTFSQLKFQEPGEHFCQISFNLPLCSPCSVKFRVLHASPTQLCQWTSFFLFCLTNHKFTIGSNCSWIVRLSFQNVSNSQWIFCMMSLPRKIRKSKHARLSKTENSVSPKDGKPPSVAAAALERIIGSNRNSPLTTGLYSSMSKWVAVHLDCLYWASAWIRPHP